MVFGDFSTIRFLSNKDMDGPWQDRPTLSRTIRFFNMKLLIAPPLFDNEFALAEYHVKTSIRHFIFNRKAQSRSVSSPLRDCVVIVILRQRRRISFSQSRCKAEMLRCAQ